MWILGHYTMTGIRPRFRKLCNYSELHEQTKVTLTVVFMNEALNRQVLKLYDFSRERRSYE